MDNIKKLEEVLEVLYNDFETQQNLFINSSGDFNTNNATKETIIKAVSYSADALIKFVTIYETLKREQNQFNLQKEIYERQQAAMVQQLAATKNQPEPTETKSAEPELEKLS